jgi:PhnB protein
MVGPTSPITRVVPMLLVRDGARAIEFYQRAFGAISVAQFTSSNGALMAELSLGGAPLFVVDEEPEYGSLSPTSLGGSSVRIELLVANPDVVTAQAISSGAREIFSVNDPDHGYPLGRVLDPFGHYWEIGRPLTS